MSQSHKIDHITAQLHHLPPDDIDILTQWNASAIVAILRDYANGDIIRRVDYESALQAKCEARDNILRQLYNLLKKIDNDNYYVGYTEYLNNIRAELIALHIPITPDDRNLPCQNSPHKTQQS